MKSYSVSHPSRMHTGDYGRGKEGSSRFNRSGENSGCSGRYREEGYSSHHGEESYSNSSGNPEYQRPGHHRSDYRRSAVTRKVGYPYSGSEEGRMKPDRLGRTGSVPGHRRKNWNINKSDCDSDPDLLFFFD